MARHIVNIGQRGPGADGVADGLEERVAVVPGQHRPRIQARRGPAPACPAQDGAGDVVHAVDAVGIAGIAQMPAAPPSASARPSRNSVLRPPCPAVAAERDGGLAAGQHHAGGPAAGRACGCCARCRPAPCPSPRLAFQRIAQDQRREAQAARRRRPCATAPSSAWRSGGIRCSARSPGFGLFVGGRAPTWRRPPRQARCRSARRWRAHRRRWSGPARWVRRRSPPGRRPAHR